MKLNLFSKLIPLVLFQCLLTQANAVSDFPTPPWSKQVSGRAQATGPKASACAQAESAARVKMAEKATELKSVCEQNKGAFSSQGSGGGVCIYYKPSGPAVYDVYGSVGCRAQ